MIRGRLIPSIREGRELWKFQSLGSGRWKGGEAGFGASPLGHGATMEIINNLLKLKLLELCGRDLGDNKVGGRGDPNFYEPGAA